jgi:hypothetical protein
MNKIKALLLVAMLFSIPHTISAQSDVIVRWDGEADSNWSNPLNWDSDILPNGADKIIIGSGSTVNLDIPFSLDGGTLEIQTGASLTINNPNELTITSGQLQVAGTLRIDGTLNIDSNLDNHGIIDNTGLLYLRADTATFNNGGVIKNYGKFQLEGYFDNNSGGQVNNNDGATILIDDSGSYFNNSFGTTITAGTLTVNGLFENSHIFIILDSGILENNSNVVNSGSFTNGGLLNNNGMIINQDGGTFTNNGTIINNGSFDIECGGTFNGSGVVNGEINSTPCVDEAPLLSLPGDYSVEDPEADGQVIFYAVSAFDEADDQDITPVCTPIAPDGLFPYGKTTITCTATDSQGNTASGTFTVTLVDTTPPNTSITSGPQQNSQTNNINPSFSFESTQTGSTFECSLDASSFVACSSPHQYQNVQDGSHTFRVRAIDVAGNIDPEPETRIWTIDTVPPAPPQITDPPNLSTVNTTPTIRGNAEQNSKIIITKDGLDIGNTIADGEGNWSFTVLSALPHGSHNFIAYARDQADNESTASNQITLNVDAMPPGVLSASISSNNANTVLAKAGDTITVSVSVDEASTAIMTIAGNPTLVSGETNSFSATYIVQPTDPQGIVAFTVSLEDMFGNQATITATTDGSSVTIDTASPTPVIGPMSSPTNQLTHLAVPVRFSEPVTGLDIDDFETSGLVVSNLQGSGDSYTVDVTLETPDGTKKLTLPTSSVIDAAGNLNLAASNEILLDQTPPTAIIISPADGSTVPDTTPISGTTEGGATVNIIVDGVKMGTVTANSDGLWSFTFDKIDDGEHTIEAVAQDGLGNTDPAPASITIIIKSTPKNFVIDKHISQSSDDAEENKKTVSLKDTDLDIGENNHIGLRFNNLEIPKGAKITNAYIQFTVEDKNGDKGLAKVRLFAQDSANAQTFTTEKNNISSRPKTTAFVDWTIPDWKRQNDAGSAQKTPNISSLIQKIVDKPDWKSNNSIVILVVKQSTNNDRDAYSFDGKQSMAPRLHIEFSVAK